MANVEEQMLQLLENEDLPYADDASAGQKRGSPFAMYARSQKRKLTDEEALAAKDEPLDVTESFNLLKANKPQYDTTTDDMLKEGFNKWKSVGTGVLTGTLAIPSDIISVSSFLADSMKKYSFTAAQLAPALKELDKKIGRKAFDEQITKLGLKSSADDPYQIAGEIFSPTGLLLGLPLKLIKATGLAAPISKVAQSSKQAFIDQTNMLTGKGPTGGNSLELADGPNVTSASEETKKLIDKGDTSTDAVAGVLRGTQTSNDPTTSIIPESEFVNAKPTINPLFAGEGTETGRKQGAKFRELEAQNKYNAEELFLQTRVYRGEDGQLRWEISTADAKLNSSWVKSLNFKKEDGAFTDEFLGIKVPEKNDDFYDGRASMQLSQLLEFPTAYKEYYNVKGVTKYYDDILTNERKVMSETQFNPLRNLKVYWDRGDKYENTLGFYRPSTDQITLNVRQLKAAAMQSAEDYGISFERAFKLQVESTLLHEVQHAVQIREGFRVGGDSDNFLPKNFDASVATNKENKYNILTNARDQVDEVVMELAKKDYSYGNNARNKILREVEDDFNTLYDVLVHKRTGSIDRYTKDQFQKGKTIQELDSLFIEAQERLDKRFANLSLENLYIIKERLFENAKENIKLINIDNAATDKYYDLYGEREARLVQKRIEDRFKLNAVGGADAAKEVESDTKFLRPEGDIDLRDRKLGKIGGFSADTKITPTKLMSDGTTFQNKRNQGGLQLAKGGTTMNMNRQMEMFEDGGLKDEGGSIDPVSGNDVPSGSTQEEVRDDIPAQLSEGEFVFPADVVRFIGLEKLMMMRQEAKSGLQRMEDMGQMGNSDEAIMPDDTPFNIDDLDMEDDTVEMAQGGVINAAYGTFVNDTSNITSTPSQFAGQNLPSQENNPNAQPVSYTPPNYNNVQDGGFSPTYFNQLTPAADNVSTFKDLVGNNYGQYDEMRKYRSESGMVLSIPFKAGQPIYPIPEGYTYIDPEETKTQAPTTTSTIPTNTRVQEVDDGQDDVDRRNEKEAEYGRGQVVTFGGIVENGFVKSTKDNPTVDYGITFSLLNPTDVQKYQGAAGFFSIVTKGITAFIPLAFRSATENMRRMDGEMYDNEVATFTKGGVSITVPSTVANDLFKNRHGTKGVMKSGYEQRRTQPILDFIDSKIKSKTDIINEVKADKSISRADFKAEVDYRMDTRNSTRGDEISPTERKQGRTRQLSINPLDDGYGIANRSDKRGSQTIGGQDIDVTAKDTAANEAKGKGIFSDKYSNEATSGGATTDGGLNTNYSTGNINEGGDGSNDGSNQETGATGNSKAGLDDFNKGGLAGKKKPKTKKMKRGGLASR